MEWLWNTTIKTYEMQIEQQLEILGFNDYIKTEAKIESQWVIHSSSEDRKRTAN